MTDYKRILVLISSFITISNSLRCERVPDGVTGHPSSPEDNFVIEISANPTEYAPGEQYTCK